MYFRNKYGQTFNRGRWGCYEVNSNDDPASEQLDEEEQEEPPKRGKIVSFDRDNKKSVGP